MSREIIRPLHGMVPRRVINAVTGEAAAYIGHAAALQVDGLSCIVVTNDQLDLSKVAALLGVEKFSVKKTSLIAMVHSSHVKLADTGFEPQLPVQPTDYDEDDEL